MDNETGGFTMGGGTGLLPDGNYAFNIDACGYIEKKRKEDGKYRGHHFKLTCSVVTCLTDNTVKCAGKVMRDIYLSPDTSYFKDMFLALEIPFTGDIDGDVEFLFYEEGWNSAEDVAQGINGARFGANVYATTNTYNGQTTQVNGMARYFPLSEEQQVVIEDIEIPF